MGLPKKKRSYTKRHMRRAHHALVQINLVNCSNCAEPTLPHRICQACGFYKGKLTMPVAD